MINSGPQNEKFCETLIYPNGVETGGTRLLVLF